ncbi:hypothetical protein HRR81_001436 [Exophiala dermatitidis]|nr:hypothetical protein HRR75_003902 [Exophiala dermatitidis]KAJ4519514.1 hypothetical protein HRR74_004258 [Exophiala dermatitidis]KAJ4529331.1 hypothetical protein HRR73_000354 [Exophiala dermatitidis]KAJ4557656.1 hypothetical protein HRR78_001328 [Exophiala dermatitidis]KAJ4582707.1 hypothetical protein HRR81_001436 [Exophiala dermatitidis]
MSVSELDGLDQNGQNGAVYRSDSSLTLTNTNSSPYQATPTPFSSDSDAISIRKQKKEATRQQGQAQLQATESEAGSHIEVALGTMSSEKSRGTVQRYLYQELDASYMSFVIILCFFISGLIDSVAFNSWNCFVDMQTGNTVFAALGLGGQPKASHSQQYYKSLTSIGAFCLGTLFFNTLHRFPTGFAEQASSRRRSTFIASFSIQTALIVVATVLVSQDLVSNQPFLPGAFSSGSNDKDSRPPAMTNFLDLCPVSLLSFQAAGQVTLSRLLGMVELPTIVLSALYHDFTADLLAIRTSWKRSPSLWEFLVVQQRRQGRRLACIIALFIGGIIGGEMYKSRAGMAGALWLAAGAKLAIVVAWCFWKGGSADNDGLPR